MLTFDHVSFQYSSKKRVLEDISFDLLQDHVYGLLGRNGVGKSTLFRLICGLNAPKTGKILALGKTPSDRNPKMLEDIFLLPEELTFPKLSPIKFGHNYGAFYPKFSPKDYEQNLDHFKVDPQQSIKTMSMGQRKKVHIAFALACHTSILLMDEPTNGLDIPSRTLFRNLIFEHKNPDTIIIISTHQVKELEGIIDAALILDEKHLVLNQTAETLLEHFHFGAIPDETPAEDIIYSEKTPYTKAGIIKKSPDTPPQSLEDFNLELLFNASMVSPESLQPDCLR